MNKSVDEKLNFLQKYRESIKEIEGHETKDKIHLVGSLCGFIVVAAILLNFNFAWTIFFGLCFSFVYLFVEKKNKKIDTANLILMFNNYPIENVDTIKEYKEKLDKEISSLIFRKNTELAKDIVNSSYNFRIKKRKNKDSGLRIIEHGEEG